MADYYIDYKNGNDTSGNGSTGTPYKTLGKALAVVSNGDTIYARGSDALDEIYYEYGKSTTKTNLTIRADTGHSPTWTPSTARTSWALTSGSVYETAYTPSAAYGVWNGATKLASTASIEACEALESSFYLDDPNNKLYVHIAGGGAPTQVNTIAGLSEIVSSAAAGVTYSGLRVQWCSTPWVFDNAGTMDGCTVRYVEGSVIGNRAAVTVSATSGTVTISNTTITGSYGGPGGYGTICVSVTGACTVSITGCAFSQMRYAMLAAIVAATINITNTTIDTARDGITFQGTADGTIDRVTVTNFDHGGIQIGGSGTAVTAKYCTCYHPTGSTNSYDNAYIVETAATALIYHCICYGMEAASGNGFGFLVQNDGTTATIQNCIAQDNKAGFRNGGGTVMITADHNCAYSNANDWSGGWTAGAGSITTDPLFVNTATYDFQLQAASPCIDAGVAIAGINDGYSGSAPDIGRYEYTPTGAPRQMMHYARIRQQ